jgi:hypothetical protein
MGNREQELLQQINLDPLWLPFTANRQFKSAPRLLVAAKDMHYTAQDGRQILDGIAGLWAVNAGHCRKPIVDAVLAEDGLTLRYQHAWSDPALVEQFRSAPGALEEELVLARAVRAGALSRGEAMLILRTRIEGVPLASIATAVNVPYEALRKRRRRAELRLCLFLGNPDVRFGGRNRPLSSARVVGDGLAGSAGGGAVTHPKQRR